MRGEKLVGLGWNFSAKKRNWLTKAHRSRQKIIGKEGPDKGRGQKEF